MYYIMTKFIHWEAPSFNDFWLINYLSNTFTVRYSNAGCQNNIDVNIFIHMFAHIVYYFEIKHKF